MAVLGVIPARGGSKRFPGKNIAPFRNRPLIAWTILAAQQAELDTLICSTDDEEIEIIALSYGCRAIKRPAHLASDHASCEAVLRHALGLFPHETVVLLQPTSPLRLASDIDDCLAISMRSGQPVVSYCGRKKNGAIYVAPSDWIQAHEFTDPHLAYFMPKARSLDIDYPKDIDDFLSGNSAP